MSIIFRVRVGKLLSIKRLEILMSCLKRGDKSVFGELYDCTHQIVYLTALRITRDNYTAEDIMQNVFLRIMEKIELYESNNAIGFIVTMTKRLALNEIKRSDKTVLTDYSDVDIVDTRSLPSAADTPLIDFAVKHLAEDEYNILIMSEIVGYKRREIAIIMNIPLSTVTYKYLKAVKYIKENYKIGGENL